MKYLIDANVVVRDRDLLGEVPPEKVISYLDKNHWKRQREIPPFYFLYEKWSHNDRVEILIPCSKNLETQAEYAFRVQEFLSVASTVDNIPPLRLLLKLLPGVEIGIKS